MVQEKPQLETWVTNGCIYALPSRLTESLHKIGDVRPGAAVIDIYQEPSLVVFRMLNCEKPFEHVLR